MALFSRYLTTLEVAVNALYNHHQDNIRSSYRCFDRILLNGLIQPFQQPESVVGFFTPIAIYTKSVETFCATSLGSFRTGSRTARKVAVPPFWKLRKDGATTSSSPTFEKQNQTEVVVSLKAREPARIRIAIGNKKDNRWHLQIAQRRVMQHNF